MKTRVSRFEYWIAEAHAEQTGDKSHLETIYCESAEKELQERKEDIQAQFDRLKVNNKSV